MITDLEPSQAYALWATHYPAHAHNPFMQAEERAMLSLLPVCLSGMRVLDVGCGSGRYLRYTTQRGAVQCLGLDLSFDMLVQGQRYVSQTSLIQAKLEQLPIMSDWSQITLCSLTIGHVPNLTQALSELARVTALDGRILLSDLHPRGEVLGWKRTFSIADKHYAIQHHFHTLHDWEQSCTDCGLLMKHRQEVFLSAQDLPSDVETDLLRQPVAIVFDLRQRAHSPL